MTFFSSRLKFKQTVSSSRMKLLYAGAVLPSLLFVSCASRTEDLESKTSTPSAISISCPDTKLQETAQDCPWAGLVRARLSQPAVSFAKLLEDRAPQILGSLEKDSKMTDLMSLWGESYNYDELKKAETVDRAILDEILSLAKVPVPRGPKETIVHAGVEHTYGYLFSNLLTSFGYKRDRWVSGEISQGLGWSPDTISPSPSKGTLMGNVTFLMASISLRKNPSALPDFTTWELPAELKSFDPTQFKIQTLQETVQLTKSRKVMLQTDLLEFQQKLGKNTHLLVYSVLDSSIGKQRLITAFPVNSGFVDGVLDSSKLGSDKTIKTRYNTHVDDFSDVTTSFSGLRELN